MSSTWVDSDEGGKRLRVERLLEDRGGEQNSVRPGAFCAALAKQHSASCVENARFAPFATTSFTKRGFPPVDS